MISTYKIFLISVAILLVSCGGGDSGTTNTTTTVIPVAAASYGAVHVNTVNGSGYIVANYPSQVEADAASMAGCKAVTSSGATNCVLYFEYGKNLCGALARSLNSNNQIVFGGGIETSATAAEVTSVAQCKKNGGTNCALGTSLAGKNMSACNGTGSSSSNSINLAIYNEVALDAIDTANESK